jgi:hypothetical protein
MSILQPQPLKLMTQDSQLTTDTDIILYLVLLNSSNETNGSLNSRQT